MISKFYTIEEFKEQHPTFIDDDEGYFNVMVWNNNADWTDTIPDEGVVVVTTDDGVIQYVLPATEAIAKEVK